MSRRGYQATSNTNEPMYGWALDNRGRPIPIAAAIRGAHDYQCPICGEPMIARKGDIKLHHFAHENAFRCTPDKVAEAIGGLWLVLSLGKRIVLKRPCMIQVELSGEIFSVDILAGITAIIERHETPNGMADIALVDGNNRVRAVLSISSPPDELALARFAANGVTTIELPMDRFRSGQLTLEELMQNARIRGGWWLVQRGPEELVTDTEQIHQILSTMVQYPPYRFWGKLVTVGKRKDVLPIHEKQLWLPEEIWQTTIGGSLNRLSDRLSVIIQEWEQPDGGTVVLYYIILRDEHAVAIRRFQPGEPVRARLNAAFRMRSTTIDQIAQLLASG